MGIWIRKQNKEALIKANDIWAYYNAIFANYVGDIHTRLGGYDSEAEAIQVLDMIQRHIANGQILTEAYDDGKTLSSEAVFQMPPAGFSQQPEKFIPGCGADLNHCELLDGTKAGVCEDYFECKAAWDRGCR